MTHIVQASKKISDITIERVKRVIQGHGDNPQPIDAGFKVFTLEKSAFPRADFAPDPDASAEQNLQALKAFIAQKETNLFSQLDPQAVRDEVLLKCGFQLDVQLTPITEVTATGVTAADYSIAGQVWIQLKAVLITLVWSGVVSVIAFKIVSVSWKKNLARCWRKRRYRLYLLQSLCRARA